MEYNKNWYYINNNTQLMTAHHMAAQCSLKIVTINNYDYYCVYLMSSINENLCNG